jgi:hypothetical protein
MKKPDYLGERELLKAIQSLHEQLNQNTSLDFPSPLMADASYHSTELGEVSVSCEIKSSTQSSPEAVLLRFTVKVQLRTIELERLVLVGSHKEIMDTLDKLAHLEAVHAFLIRIYRELSELEEQ